MTIPYANIHHFNYDPASGDACYDEEGEPLFGFYYELMNSDGSQKAGLMGPYTTALDAEVASARDDNG